MVLAVPFCEYTKNNCIVHMKQVTYMACEL